MEEDFPIADILKLTADAPDYQSKLESCYSLMKVYNLLYI